MALRPGEEIPVLYIQYSGDPSHKEGKGTEKWCETHLYVFRGK